MGGEVKELKSENHVYNFRLRSHKGIQAVSRESDGRMALKSFLQK
jgi:hypothetical protein